MDERTDPIIFFEIHFFIDYDKEKNGIFYKTETKFLTTIEREIFQFENVLCRK